MTRFKINKHHNSYDKATEHALRAIYEGVDIRVDGQVYTYNKESNELTIKDYCLTSIYKPRFNGGFCNPFANLVRQEVHRSPHSLDTYLEIEEDI